MAARLLPDGVDLRPELSPKRRQVFVDRLRTLDAGLVASARAATAAWHSVAPSGAAGPLLLRQGFSYLARPSSVDPSDRKLPPPERRPPATRIMKRRGATLRLELIALAYAQATHRPGTRATNDLPLVPQRADDFPVGWRDLIASDAVRRTDANMSVSVNDKKLRQLHSAVDGLIRAGLARLQDQDGARTDRERFQLLDERGPAARPGLELLEYLVPRAKEPLFALPADFVANGWIHLLGDAELVLLLMVACRRGNNPGEQDVAIPGDTRVHHYGIGPDVYTRAHVGLRLFGLLNVDELGRREDGRAIGYNDDPHEAHLHRLRLVPDGFAADPCYVIPATLRERLA